MQQDDDLGMNALTGGIGVTVFSGVNSDGTLRADVESKPHAAAMQQAQELRQRRMPLVTILCHNFRTQLCSFKVWLCNHLHLL